MHLLTAGSGSGSHLVLRFLAKHGLAKSDIIGKLFIHKGYSSKNDKILTILTCVLFTGAFCSSAQQVDKGIKQFDWVEGSKPKNDYTYGV